jgi:hypothetical protein
MDREEGFPPHVIGFMKRKREKEKLNDAKPLKDLLGDEPGRAPNILALHSKPSARWPATGARPETFF